MAWGRLTGGLSLQLRLDPGEEDLLFPVFFICSLLLKQALFHALHVSWRKRAGLFFLKVQRLVPECIEYTGHGERLIGRNNKFG